MSPPGLLLDGSLEVFCKLCVLAVSMCEGRVLHDLFMSAVIAQ